MNPLVPNRPSPEGRAIGEQLARLTETALAVLRRDFPDHAEPCQSCAFRRDTVPNGCLSTVADAMKCVVEKVEFRCHQSPGCTDICMGYLIAATALRDMPPMKAPWDFDDANFEEGAP